MYINIYGWNMHNKRICSLEKYIEKCHKYNVHIFTLEPFIRTIKFHVLCRCSYTLNIKRFKCQEQSNMQ